MSEKPNEIVLDIHRLQHLTNMIKAKEQFEKSELRIQQALTYNVKLRPVEQDKPDRMTMPTDVERMMKHDFNHWCHPRQPDLQELKEALEIARRHRK